MRYFFIFVAMSLLTFSCQEESNSSVDPETGKVVSRPVEKPAQEMAEPTGVISEIDSRYRLVELAPKEMTIPLDTIQIIANFKSGVLSGNGGCNYYNTSFTVAENKSIEIGKVTTTKKMCRGILGIERKYFDLLEGAKSYERLDANRIRILSEGGALTFTLQDK